MKEEIFKKYHQVLLKWCLSKTQKMIDAEDLLQDIYYQLLKAFSKKIVIADEERFIWKVAYYTWCKKVRDYQKQRRYLNVSDEIINIFKDENTDILKYVEKEEITDILNKNIFKLKDIYRTIIDLYYYHDLSIKEIATKLSINESLVKYYLFQARKELRRCLENEKIS